MATSRPSTHAGATPLLEVDGLTVTFHGDGGGVRAVSDLSLTVEPGQRLGLAGESGAGKTVTALSLLRLLPQPPAHIRGRIAFDGQDLSAMSGRGLRQVRGSRIAMIFQDPASCLSPRLTVGAQVIEAVRAHGTVGRRDARARALDLLSQVGIPAPDLRMREYPHRLSGGMAQRVMIAIALAGDPELLIADEPTTALDVSIEAQIVELLTNLCRQRGMAVVFITHDLGILARFAEDVAIMYAGRIVESGRVDDIYQAPAHPYSQGLLASVTRPDTPSRGRLSTIDGTPPSAAMIPTGCSFHPRCPHAVERCQREVPQLQVHGHGHRAACHRSSELELGPIT